MVTESASSSSTTPAQKIYLFLSLVGIIAPYALLMEFVYRHGLDAHLFLNELFGTYPGTMAMADLLLSSIVFWFWLFSTEQKHGVRFPWIFVILNLTVGLCCALPLFLYARSCSLTAFRAPHFRSE